MRFKIKRKNKIKFYDLILTYCEIMRKKTTMYLCFNGQNTLK